ncbi:MAG: ABC transporter ATP-binding protein, partial [Bacillota bacterium]
MIDVIQAKKYYGQTRGVESVTMTVKQGEILGFVGP